MDVPHEQPALSSSKSNRFTSQRQTTGVGTTTVERLEPRLSPASRHITEAKAFGTECHVSSFTREQDPDRAVRVEQIHGEAYVAAGHVYESALDELGRLDNSKPSSSSTRHAVAPEKPRSYTCMRFPRSPSPAAKAKEACE